MALNDNRNSAEELVQPAHHLDLVVPNDTPHHTTHCQLSSVQSPVGAVLIGATVDPRPALSGDALSMLWTVRAPLARVCAAARGLTLPLTLTLTLTLVQCGHVLANERTWVQRLTVRSPSLSQQKRACRRAM